MRKQVSINDLPKFSPWPKRILGVESWNRPKRSLQDTIREFESEKWSPMLERVRRNAGLSSIELLDAEVLGVDREILCSAGEQLELMRVGDAQKMYFDLVLSVLRQNSDSPGIVELGAGCGSMILRLAASKVFTGKFFAGELTVAGRGLIEVMASRMKLDVEVGECDLSRKEITSLSVPEGSVVYTSYAAHYQPRIEKDFIQSLLALKPSKVIHFEPIYEHFLGDQLIDLFRRRYIEINEYSNNLRSVISDCEKSGMIRVVDERLKLFGLNPLLPVSVIAWEPDW